MVSRETGACIQGVETEFKKKGDFFKKYAGEKGLPNHISHRASRHIHWRWPIVRNRSGLQNRAIPGPGSPPARALQWCSGWHRSQIPRFSGRCPVQ